MDRLEEIKGVLDDPHRMYFRWVQDMRWLIAELDKAQAWDELIAALRGEVERLRKIIKPLLDATVTLDHSPAAGTCMVMIPADAWDEFITALREEEKNGQT